MNECKNVPRWEDIQLARKTTKTFELQFDSDGAPVDITGWTIYFTVKEKMNDTDANAKISRTVTTHTEPTNGKTLIELTVSDTDIPAGNYYYSIDSKDDDDNEQVLFYGRVRIIEPVRDYRG